jgi:hypothetical protein
MGHEKVVQLLLERGGDVNAKTNAEFTALHQAVTNGNETVVQQLLEHGAFVNAIDVSGETPLHIAARRGAEKAARTLLQRGAIIDYKSYNGITPLDVAISYGNKSFVGFILQLYRDTDCRAVRLSKAAIRWHIASIGHFEECEKVAKEQQQLGTPNRFNLDISEGPKLKNIFIKDPWKPGEYPLVLHDISVEMPVKAFVELVASRKGTVAEKLWLSYGGKRLPEGTLKLSRQNYKGNH